MSPALRQAYLHGVKTAFARLKVAIEIPGIRSMGADPGVQPSGPEQTHGTDRVLQARGQRDSTAPAEHLPQDQFNSDWLWNMSEYDRLAPGYTGEWGQEVIG